MNYKKSIIDTSEFDIEYEVNKIFRLTAKEYHSYLKDTYKEYELTELEQDLLQFSSEIQSENSKDSEDYKKAEYIWKVLKTPRLVTFRDGGRYTYKRVEPPRLKRKTILNEELNEKPKVLHSHIFVDNSIVIWEYLFEEFGINESSRTDVKFTFEKMKKDGYIHNTVNQVKFLEWIHETYDIDVQKTSNIDLKNRTRLRAYSKAIDRYKN